MGVDYSVPLPPNPDRKNKGGKRKAALESFDCPRCGRKISGHIAFSVHLKRCQKSEIRQTGMGKIEAAKISVVEENYLRPKGGSLENGRGASQTKSHGPWHGVVLEEGERATGQASIDLKGKCLTASIPHERKIFDLPENDDILKWEEISKKVRGAFLAHNFGCSGAQKLDLLHFTISDTLTQLGYEKSTKVSGQQFRRTSLGKEVGKAKGAVKSSRKIAQKTGDWRGVWADIRVRNSVQNCAAEIEKAKEIRANHKLAVQNPKKLADKIWGRAMGSEPPECSVEECEAYFEDIFTAPAPPRLCHPGCHLRAQTYKSEHSTSPQKWSLKPCDKRPVRKAHRESMASPIARYRIFYPGWRMPLRRCSTTSFVSRLVPNFGGMGGPCFCTKGGRKNLLIIGQLH